MAGPHSQRPINVYATEMAEVSSRTPMHQPQQAGGGAAVEVAETVGIGQRTEEGVDGAEQSVNAIATRGASKEEGDVEGSTKRRRNKHRPLLRRLFNYVRNTLIGTKSSADDLELEELELPPRYRPESISALCQITRFNEAEIKRIYRGFKAECPSGVVREDTFKLIYSQFFMQSGLANSGPYAHYVFNTLDQDNSGIINFEDFIQTLSILSRGSLEEKLTWTFALYDINGDGYVTKEEMTDIVTAIYDMVELAPSETRAIEERIKTKVDALFQKMDTNRDGVVTLDEFIDCCRNDEVISNSMTIFDAIVL
ncbi:Kv channel-interacting protein 4-like isoform X2 [Phlebotomus argentipes]|uniref:Kv channel-interacting protein 4-like isoform X2 n=1 Tax=Phlebotomus argentipes TaxID=94469 RepID=UPI00289305D8|nr:Kv channel-interacting protein 4-like isoform X2 [Phlebotomus argentipes]